MKNIYLDPDREGCMVFSDNNVARINGKCTQIADNLARRISKSPQTYNIYVETVGCGLGLKDSLEHLGFSVNKINSVKIDEMLPCIY